MNKNQKLLARECRVCGAQYKSCYACESTKSWRMLTDTAEHYYILCVLMGYQTDHDAKKAYDALCRYGVSFEDLDGYTKSAQSLMEDIYLEMQEEDEEIADEIVFDWKAEQTDADALEEDGEEIV